MDEDSLRSTLRVMKKKIDQLTEILEDHRESWKGDPSVPFNPHPCLYLVQKLHKDIEEDADNDAENMSEMVHHIADKVIKDTVDRLADRMRSRPNQSQLATSMIDLYFEGPGSGQRRKVIEARLKKKLPWDALGFCEGSFEEALQAYEGEVEETALGHATEHMKEMTYKITGT
ncbi:hypothetical protein KCU78_g11230, partial [Aureobasidium melanogenum]